MHFSFFMTLGFLSKIKVMAPSSAAVVSDPALRSERIVDSFPSFASAFQDQYHPGRVVSLSLRFWILRQSAESTEPTSVGSGKVGLTLFRV